MVWVEMSYNQYNQSALTISERLRYEYELEEIFEYNEEEDIDEFKKSSTYLLHSNR